MRLLLAIFALAFAGHAYAHDEWGDGTPVPAWVKEACCGPKDVHRLRADQCVQMSNGNWRVDGYKGEVNKLGPIYMNEHDGYCWAFYNDFGNAGQQSNMYCLFVVLSM